MRIALLVPRIHFHAPFVLRSLVPRARRGEDRYLVVTTPKLPGRSGPLWRRLAGLVRASGPEYLLAMAALGGLQLARGSFERLLRRPLEWRRSLSVREAGRLLGAETARVASMREPVLFERLSKFRPDLLCAVFFNQIVPARLRFLPRLGAINLHPSHLPRYRGISPCFWALARGEASTGVTIHRMTGEADSGLILARARVEIAPGDTLHSLYRRCAVRGGELLSSLLSDPERLAALHGTLPEGEGSYFAGITGVAVREFRARGCKFF